MNKNFDLSSPTYFDSMVSPPWPGTDNLYRKIVVSSSEVIFAETYLFGEYECHVRKEDFSQEADAPATAQP